MDPIFLRTSVRDFLPDQIEKGKIVMILKAAMQAPSAKNQQPWEFYVVSNEETKQLLSSASVYAKCAKEAPICLVPCLINQTPCPDYSLQDMSLACENILLEAETLGLGGVYLGIYPNKERVKKVQEALNIPSTLTPFCIIPLGYPKTKKVPSDRYDPLKVHYVK